MVLDEIGKATPSKVGVVHFITTNLSSNNSLLSIIE